MKQKKKKPLRVSLFTLMLVMMALVTACGGKNEKDVAGTITPSESSDASLEKRGTLVETESEEASAGVESEENTSEEAGPEGKPLSLGRIQGGIYSNEYLGLTCELDSNWEFYTAEELQQLPDEVTKMVEGSELGEYMANVQQITDVMAENAALLASFNIQYTKMSVQERLAYSSMTDEEILDSVLSQSDLLIKAYAQAGIEVEDMNATTVSFLGSERPALQTSSTIDGIPYYTLQVYDYHLGEYGVTITFSSYMEDKNAEVMALFKPLE